MASTLAIQEKPPEDEILPQENPSAKPTFLVGSPQEAKTSYKSSYYEPSFEFPWNPDPLVRGNNYKIYDEMRDDDQIKVVLSIKKDFVVNTGWYIDCENEEIKEFIENNLNNLETGDGLECTFDEVLRDMLSAYDFGFSIAEPIFQLNAENLYEYKTVKVRPPHSFRFELNASGDVETIIQSTDEGEEEFPPDIFLHYAYQQEYGNPFGKSDLRAAHGAWKAKKFILKFFNIYLEKFASPTIVGKYPDNYTDADVTNFFSKLKSVQNNTTLVLPMSAMVDFVQQQRDASKAFVDALNFYNLQISRAILVPDLMGVGGEKTSGGSFALGKEQIKIFLNTIAKDRLLLEKKITSRLIQPLVKTNWGEYECSFKFHPYSHEDEIELARLWKDLISTGKVKPTEEEVNHFRTVVRFPEGPVEIIDPMQMNPEIPFNPQDKKPEVQNGKKPEELQKEKNEQAGEQKTKEEFLFRAKRSLTVYENKINFTQIEEVLDNSEEDVGPKLTRAAKDIWMDLIDQIRSKRIASDFKPEKIEDIKPRFLRQMNIIFRDHFKILFKESLEEARKEIFPNGTKQFIDQELLPEEFLAIIEAESFKTVGDYSNEITKKAKNILVKGIKDGVPPSELYQLIRKEMESVSDKWLNTVIRTKTTEVYNAARKTYWESDPLASQIVEAYQWSAILDERTSDICLELDGKIYAKGDYIDKLGPPAHINAIAKGEKVLTKRGNIPIEDVIIGDEVMTHLGNWNKVYDVMKKNNDDFDYVLEILTEDGYLKLTPDHPILTQGHWSPAGCLRMNDQIFKTRFYSSKSFFIFQRSSENSKNSVSLSNKPLIPFNVLKPSFPMASFFIKLYNNLAFWNNPVRNVIAYGYLKFIFKIPFFEKFLEYCFRFCRFISHYFGKRFSGFNFNTWDSHGIIFTHCDRTAKKMGMSFLSQSRSPMFEIGTFMPISQNNARSLPLSSGFNTKLSASISKNINTAQIERSSDTSQGFTFSKMALLNHGLDEFGTVDIHAYNYNEGRTILSIRKVPYEGEVYNLSVENDESYLVNGYVVHNCRSLLIPISKFEEYETSKEVPIEKLQELGGNLIL